MYRTLLLAGCLVSIAASSAVAQRNLKDIPPPDPEIERKSFQLADGFEINLFAADPQLAKPIQMNFDAQGRLWIATSSVYPQIKPGQEENDKVLILEDSDGDGRADKTQVFADGLLIPTGVVPGHGGAYVANSTEIVHFKDTDGDGKADFRKVVLSGFGTEDTHHIIHTFRFGPDARFYFNQSVYIHSHVETPYGVRRLNAGGIWQFRPETMRLEVFCRGMWNTWGHTWDRFGQSFATDGAGSEGIHYIIPGASYAATPNVRRRFAGLNPGHPKYCGAELVSGRHLPDDWQGDIVTCDFRANRVCRFSLVEDGAGFAARQQPDVIRSTHVAFRPIDVKMGPDGAIYIADWYNPIIQHGEVDFRDPRRDKVHGRIWRLTAKNRPLVKRPQLTKASTPELLEQLKSPEGWTRHFAKRVLVERGPEEVVKPLDGWVASLDANGEQYEHRLLEALWVYQGLRHYDPLLIKLLHAQDGRVRAAAVRVLLDWREEVRDPLRLLAERVSDDHPRVRLEAVRALAEFKSPQAMSIALAALDRPLDRFLDYALWLTANDLSDVWLPEVKSGQLTFDGKSRHLEFALSAVASKGVIQPLLKLIRDGRIPAERQENVLSLVAGLGGPNELKLIFEEALSGEKLTPAHRAALLSALGQSARTRKTRPAGDLKQLLPLLAAEDLSLQKAAVELAGTWQLDSARQKLAELAAAEDSGDGIRAAALGALAQLGGKASAEIFGKLAREGSLPFRAEAIAAWSQMDARGAASAAVKLLPQFAATSDELADVFQAFTRTRQGPAALSQALTNKKLPADVAKIGVRIARSAPRVNKQLVDALTKSGDLGQTAQNWTEKDVLQLVELVNSSGDPAEGERIFRRQQLGCLKCHAIGGSGGQVGPDLTSIGGSAQVDYLVESLVMPNKKIKENYHSIVVATDDGKVRTGIKVRQTNQVLVLRDAEDREITIPVDSIEEQAEGKSLMPVGLIEPLTRQEIAHLVKFLSRLGKVGPYAVGREQIVRTWRSLANDQGSRHALNRKGYGQAASDDASLTWEPVYSRVSGGLPIGDLPQLVVRRNAAPVSFVRFAMQVTTGGPVGLQFNSTEALTLWVDGHPHELAPEITLDLAAGTHTVTIGIEAPSRKNDLRVMLSDNPDSPARVQLVKGK